MNKTYHLIGSTTVEDLIETMRRGTELMTRAGSPAKYEIEYTTRGILKGKTEEEEKYHSEKSKKAKSKTILFSLFFHFQSGLCTRKAYLHFTLIGLIGLMGLF